MKLPETLMRFLARSVDGITVESGASRGLFDPAPIAGMNVDEDTVLSLAAFWGCVRYISSQVAIMPMGLYRNDNGKRTEVRDHPVWAAIRERPSPAHSPYVLKEALVWNALATGNGYAERKGPNLYILAPSTVQVYRTIDRRIMYEVTDVNGDKRALLPSEIIHLKGPSRDGIVGLSVISYARETLSGGLAVQGFGNAFFGNGTHVGGVYQMDGVLSDDQYDRLKQQLLDDRGSKRAHRPRILEGGLKYVANTIAPQDAQFLESRKFSAREVCALFGVPPHKVGIEDGATAYASREQAAIEAAVDCLTPWVVRLENEADYKLLTAKERSAGLYTHLNMDVLLRGDAKSRAEANQIRLRNGSLSPNEWAALEESPPMDGGDERMVSRDLIPLSKVNEYVDSQMAPERSSAERNESSADRNEDAMEPLVDNAMRLIDERREKSGINDEFEAKVWAPVLEAASRLGVEIGESHELV